MLTKNLIIFLFAFLLLPKELLPQESISFGGYLGGGVISGNTTDKGSFSSSFFFEVDPGFYKDLSIRLSFLYDTDFFFFFFYNKQKKKKFFLKNLFFL